MTTDSWPPPEGAEPGKSGLSRRDFIKIAAASAAAAAAVSSGAALPAFAGPTKKTKMDTPIISCFESTQASISIRVCAGATGAPAGFSIQWMTLAEYQGTTVPGGGTKPANTWYDSTVVCKASFSGNANLSRYNLAPAGDPNGNDCVTVNVGDFLLDQGASTNCPDELVCGTEYVFRAFAHATSTLNRSDFTANLTCITDNCGSTGQCTFTQGYWKTHGPEGCIKGNNTNEWPVTSLTLGTVPPPLYSDVQLCSIFNASVGGNGLIALAHQLIAAKLNVANGADDTAVAGYIAAADALIGGLVVPPVGSGSLPSSQTSALTEALRKYNEGDIGPGHCG